jgi:hypothetical protein
MEAFSRVYDGTLMCHTSNCCPVVDHDQSTGLVIIHDPAKPENGKFTMTKNEWNTLVRNAQPIEGEA